MRALILKFGHLAMKIPIFIYVVFKRLFNARLVSYWARALMALRPLGSCCSSGRRMVLAPINKGFMSSSYDSL